tara:strand:- start:10198 stop:10782 length:585 start_codon:yes stop_codon:yes gene_type:complete
MVNFSFTYPTTKEVIDKGNNGEFGRLQLRSVGDGEKLYKVAADSYLRMKRAAKKDGVNIKLNDGYRRCGEKGDYNENKSKGEFTQWYAWELYQAGKGNLASDPRGGCKSNHGWGLAIDVNGYENQEWIKKNGEKYGWYWTGGTFSQVENWHFDYFKDKDTMRKRSNVFEFILYGSMFLAVVGFAVGLSLATRKK